MYKKYVAYTKDPLARARFIIHEFFELMKAYDATARQQQQQRRRLPL